MQLTTIPSIFQPGAAIELKYRDAEGSSIVRKARILEREPDLLTVETIGEGEVLVVDPDEKVVFSDGETVIGPISTVSYVAPPGETVRSTKSAYATAIQRGNLHREGIFGWFDIDPGQRPSFRRSR